MKGKWEKKGGATIKEKKRRILKSKKSKVESPKSKVKQK